MSVKTKKWVRVGLVYLTVSFLVVGVWATLDPGGFYESFPGGGRAWVAGDGPYNAHLTGDVGVGFLAVGVVLLLAAIWTDVRLIQAASVAAVVHDVPHLVFHLRHPNDALGSVDTLLSNGGLAMGAFVATLLLVLVTRAQSGAPPATGSAAGPNRSRQSDAQVQTNGKERTT